MTQEIRLQKYLAKCGIASRRKAEEFIKAGRVTVDGKTVTEMGYLVIPGKHKITCDRKVASLEQKTVYYLLNKPKGYVTTLSDPQGRPVVTSLIKDSRVRLFPVGRLDLDTEGALLLTNDGGLAQRIQHPSFHTNKSYLAIVSGVVPPEQIKLLETGIILEGKRTAPASVKMLKKMGSRSQLKITIYEGRKRQIRKMFKLIGHPVIELKRVAYGKLSLGNLKSGQYRQLNSSELKKIFL